MTEDDSEVLDWGNEDDVVSLGDEEESYTLQNPALPLHSAPGTPPIVNEARTPSRSHSPLPLNNSSSSSVSDQKSKQLPSTETAKPTPNTTPQSGHKLTILPRLTHALPPKPVTTSVPYVPPSDPSIVEATAMATRLKKPDNSTAAATTTTPTHNLKNGSHHDHIGPLPVPWEVCIPRSGNGIYYHNSQTGQTQWDRPSSAPVVPPPATLSHDDRHYRPSDDRYPSHGRLYSNTLARSPRGRNRSRSVSPPPPTTGRDSRARGNNQRPARGRTNTKTNVLQREPDSGDLPKADDRHWVPSPPSSSNKARNGRRQRRQNHSIDDRPADSGPEEPDPLPSQRDTDARGHNHGRERTYTPSDNSSSRTSAPRPATPPPPRDDHPTPYEVKVEVPRESLQERRRSPDPPKGQRSSETLRRERPSRFGPGSGPGPSSTVLERGNGLPMKPVVTRNDRSGDSRRANSDRPYDRRAEQDRRYEDSTSQDIYPAHPAPAARSPVMMRDQVGGFDRSRVPSAKDDRDKTSSTLENTSSSRKRPPLPPQEAEFREIGRPRPTNYPEHINQRPEEVPRRSGAMFYDRDQGDRETNLLLSRSYPPREDARDVGYSQAPPPSRNLAPVDYDHRDYDRDFEYNRSRPRQRFDEREDVQRGYDRLIDSMPTSDIRGGYAEREREPPSKPRAMHVPGPSPSSVYPGPSNPAPVSTPTPAPNRYHDRPSPPHLSIGESRRDIDIRSVPPASTGPERREAKVYHPSSERPSVREPHGRTAPTSSANSIPIGNKRVFTPLEPPVSEHHPPVPNDRYGRPSYPAQEPPRPVKADHSRTYPEIESTQEARQKYPRIARETSFPQTAPDERAYGRRGEKPDFISRIHAPPPTTQPENPPRSRPTRFSSDNRNSRFDHEPTPALATSKNWSGDGYDTSPRVRYRDDPVRDPTPPPLSRETSYTSPQWDPPSSSSSFHDPHVPHVYHELPPPPVSRMDIDPPSSRQALGSSVAYNDPIGERYRREEVDFREPTRAPLLAPPRGGNRRDQSYSPEIQRAPVELSDSVERGGGSLKRNPSNASVDHNPRNERPWMATERHPLPFPPLPEARRQTQENRTDNAYNGEPPGVIDTRQVDYAPLPAKTFEQRLSMERPPMPPRGASLLSRISRGGNDVPPPPSLRERVQVGIKRDRDDIYRDHLPDRPLEVDDSETDYAGAKRGKKRRRNRRGGPP